MGISLTSPNRVVGLYPKLQKSDGGKQHQWTSKGWTTAGRSYSSRIVGFIVGLIASAIMHTHMGFIGTTLLGIIGSVVGGLLARLFSRPAEGSRFHPAGFFMSIIGAIVVVFLVRLVGG